MNNMNFEDAVSRLSPEELAVFIMRSLTLKRWLTTWETALLLGTTKEGIKKRRYRGKLVPKKIDGTLYYDREALDRRFEDTSPNNFKLLGR